MLSCIIDIIPQVFCKPRSADIPHAYKHRYIKISFVLLGLSHLNNLYTEKSFPNGFEIRDMEWELNPRCMAKKWRHPHFQSCKHRDINFKQAKLHYAKYHKSLTTWPNSALSDMFRFSDFNRNCMKLQVQ